ncbi:hypothetical protein Tsubulata_002109 [Turnera subulata]|uniref:C2H2-type domain-containing protein n=1 Tax=Turnera subulata TaxID=218843 RepID=A0A9Q0JGG1_9ROSI|nr:hypothetical protein Tsubulata_002109 [Turnera subulata]
MSVKLQQPVGQKRLTNVAVVRLKKHGMRFEIACFKNKVLSWRSGVEKDLDEVLQSHTVYSNVSKGILAKSTDLMKAFGTDNQTQICLQILDKGELQVAGKERESQLSSQFRDIATIVMQKTFNPETQRPYTINMIERLMHEIHFAVDPNSSSKKQAWFTTFAFLLSPLFSHFFDGLLSFSYLALEVIHELEKQFPIKRSPMRLRLTVTPSNLSSLVGKLNSWNATITSRDESDSQIFVICEVDPGVFRECNALVRNLQGRLEMLAASVHFEGDTHVDDYDDHEVALSSMPPESVNSSQGQKAEASGKQNKCTTCNASFGDAKEYRDHFKSDWHKHNLRRKTRQLPPLTAEECLADVDLDDSKADLKDYLF